MAAQEHTQQTSNRRQEKALDQYLPDDAAARCAQSGPQGKLPRLEGPARQHDAHYVTAGSQQGESKHAQQNGEPELILSDCLTIQIAPGHHRRLSGSLLLGMSLRPALMNTGQVLARLFEGHAFLQPTHGKTAESGMTAVGVGAERPPDIPGLREIGLRRKYTDDGEGIAIESQGATENRRVSSEQPLPEAEAHESHFRRARPVFFAHEIAAEYRLEPQDRQKVVGARRRLTRSAVSSRRGWSPKRNRSPCTQKSRCIAARLQNEHTQD